MRYLLLLYGDEEGARALTDGERREIVDRHHEFGRRLRERGAHVHGEALRSSQDAKTARREKSRQLVTDGPFAETKEQVGGFYVIECASVEEALGWAREVPPSPGLVVEVRPVVDA